MQKSDLTQYQTIEFIKLYIPDSNLYINLSG
jgi:hypothetical protein